MGLCIDKFVTAFPGIWKTFGFKSGAARELVLALSLACQREWE